MLSDGKKVYLSCGATDLRKSIDALSAMVQESFQLDPYDDTLYVFCNRSRDLMKILEWDGDGFWLHTKKLEGGHFPWPDTAGSATMGVTYRELETIIDSARLRTKLKRRDVFQPVA